MTSIVSLQGVDPDLFQHDPGYRQRLQEALIEYSKKDPHLAAAIADCRVKVKVDQGQPAPQGIVKPLLKAAAAAAVVAGCSLPSEKSSGMKQTFTADMPISGMITFTDQ